MQEFLESLGQRARERPSPTVKGSIVAAGAFVAMVGLFAIAADQQDDGTNVVGILLGAVAVAAGHTIILRLDEAVRPAGIVLISLGTAASLGFLLDDLNEPAPLFLLLSLAFLLQWAVGPARGAMPLLTLGLLSVWGLVLDLVAGDPDRSDFVNDPFGDSSDDPLSAVPDTTFTSNDDTVAYVSLIIGVAFLVAARRLDSKGWHGVATSAVIAGDIAFVIGVFGVVGTFESDVLGGLLVIAAGATLALMGATGGRRLSTWLGGLGIVIGILVLINTAVELDDLVAFGITATIVGAAIILAAAFLDPGSFRRTPPASRPAADPGPAQALPAQPLPAQPLPAQPLPDAVPELGWHPDPAGRHELRWHNGSDWTTHVSNQGEVSEDEGR